MMIPLAQTVLLYMGPHGGPGCPFGFFPFGFFWLAAILGVVIWMRSGGFRSGGGNGPDTPPGTGTRQAATQADGDGPEWPALHPDESPRSTRGPQGEESRGPIGYF